MQYALRTGGCQAFSELFLKYFLFKIYLHYYYFTIRWVGVMGTYTLYTTRQFRHLAMLGGAFFFGGYGWVSKVIR